MIIKNETATPDWLETASDTVSQQSTNGNCDNDGQKQEKRRKVSLEQNEGNAGCGVESRDLNIGSMTGQGRGVGDKMDSRKLVLCEQETR